MGSVRSDGRAALYLGAHAAAFPCTGTGRSQRVQAGSGPPRPQEAPLPPAPTRSRASTPVPGAAPLAALRAATRARHDRLEARVDAVAAFSAIDTYTAFLTRLHGFHAPLEPLLDAHRSAFSAVAPLPPRAERLARDLLVLGIDPATTPRCVALPRLATDAEVVGTIYVIEGSALGGAVLARLAARQLGLGPATGAGFLAADADLAARWRLVVQTVESAAATHGVDGVIAGARETFDAMEAWLCR